MFAIYNNGSVGFRSTVDNLYEAKKTDAPDKIEMKPDDDSLFQEFLSGKDKEKKQNKDQAIDAYKKVAKISNSDPIYHVEDIMTKECTYVDKYLTVQDAYDTLKLHGVSQIPVIENNNKIVSMINKKLILNLLIEDIDNAKEILRRKLDDLYLPEIITTHPITDIRRVAKVMIDFKLDAVPVVNENDVLVGIVSKSDIIKAVSHIPKLQLWS